MLRVAAGDRITNMKMTALLPIAALLLVSACTTPATSTATTTPVAATATATSPAATATALAGGRQLREADAQREVGSFVRDTLAALKTRNASALSAIAHPSKGVRFSKASYVLPASDITLSATQLANAYTDPTVRMWGRTDGRGDAITLTFSEYHAQYIYGRDFATAQRTAYNETIGRGNSTDNTATVYPDAVLFEAYDPGTDPSKADVQWQALRLLFERSGTRWYLVGVVHGEWSI